MEGGCLRGVGDFFSVVERIYLRTVLTNKCIYTMHWAGVLIWGL